MRSALCRVCCTFVTAHPADLLMALRAHVLEQAATHHMNELTCVTLDGEFERIIRTNQPWNIP